MKVIVPVTTSNITDWVRKAAAAINRGVQREDATIYAGDTAGVGYDQAKLQALMDAVEELSNRLK